MREMWVTAFAHNHKRRPLTWLFRLAKRLREGVKTMPIHQPIEATGSLPHDVVLSMAASQWTEDWWLVYSPFWSFLSCWNPLCLGNWNKETLAPNLSVCEFGIQFRHLEATLPTASIRALDNRPPWDTPPTAPPPERKWRSPTHRPSPRLLSRARLQSCSPSRIRHLPRPSSGVHSQSHSSSKNRNSAPFSPYCSYCKERDRHISKCWFANPQFRYRYYSFCTSITHNTADYMVRKNSLRSGEDKWLASQKAP